MENVPSIPKMNASIGIFLQQLKRPLPDQGPGSGKNSDQ
jgi:hypothetical protein